MELREKANHRSRVERAKRAGKNEEALRDLCTRESFLGLPGGYTGDV